MPAPTTVTSNSDVRASPLAVVESAGNEGLPPRVFVANGLGGGPRLGEGAPGRLVSANLLDRLSPVALGAERLRGEVAVMAELEDLDPLVAHGIGVWRVGRHKEAVARQELLGAELHAARYD